MDSTHNFDLKSQLEVIMTEVKQVFGNQHNAE